MDHGSGNMDMGASCKVCVLSFKKGGQILTHHASLQVSMLWNWDTVDACFLSSTWHIHTTGQSPLFVLLHPRDCRSHSNSVWSSICRHHHRHLLQFVLLVEINQNLLISAAPEHAVVALIELVRRFGREYDRRCISAHLAKLSIHGTPPSASSTAQLNKSDSDGGDIAYVS